MEIATPRQGWETFTDLVQHTSRFVFMKSPNGGTHRQPDGGQVAAGFADDLMNLLRQYKHRLVKSLPVGTIVHRARLAETRRAAWRNWERGEYNAAGMGAAPRDRAGVSRLSPAGISFFYGATDPKTAIAEVAAHDDKRQDFAVVGAFRTSHELAILDLRTANLKAPSVFDEGGQAERDRFQFLMGFVADIVKPVRLDGRDHREYAPTQAITELVRWSTDPSVDGILLPSAQRKNGENLVLFFGHPDDTDGKGTPQPYALRPEDVSLHRIERRIRAEEVERFVTPPLRLALATPAGLD